MATNNRKELGKKAGYWSGTEVEHTQFYGMPTLFIGQWPASAKVLALAKDKFPHVYFCMGRNDFWTLYPPMTQSLLSAIRLLLADPSKAVTVDIGVIGPNVYCGLDLQKALHDLRQRFLRQFCLSLTVQMPMLELGAFAIKVAPPQTFTERPLEGCVQVVPSSRFADGSSHWPEYSADVDGEEA